MEFGKENARGTDGRDGAKQIDSDQVQMIASKVNHGMQNKRTEPLFEEMERYCAAGMQLIPLHSWNAKDLRGRSKGKTPRDKGWQKRTYSNEEVLKRSRHLKSNVGIRLTNEILVLDVDPRNFLDGRDSLKEMAAILGIDLSLAPHTVTGSNGHHYWFRKPNEIEVLDTIEEYPGIEFKSKGRQVVAAGSVHPNGRHYVWDEASPSLLEMPNLPDPLLKLIQRRSAPAGPSDAGELSIHQMEVGLSYLDPCDFQDQKKWLDLAMSCHYATNGEGREEFIEWSIQDADFINDSWLIGRRWDSFHAKASSGNAPITEKLLYKLVHEAGGQIPHPRPEDEFEPWIEDISPAPQATRWNFLSLDELEALKPPQWLIPDILVESSLAMVYGAPESGKSFLAIDMAMSIAGGVDWHGRRTLHGGVLYIAAEGAPGLGKRVRAWKASHGLEKHSYSLWLMRDEINFASQKDSEINAFIEAASALPISLRLIVIDTLNQTSEGADENSSQDMGSYIARMKKLRDRTGATIMVVHHSGKDESKGPRGSTALLGAMDTTVEVKRPDRNSIEVKVKKQKDAERASPIHFNLEKTADSLVLKPTMIPDYQESPGTRENEVVELACRMAAAHNGRFPLKDLVTALLPSKKSESSARRIIEKTIGRTKENAVMAANGTRIWLERKGANPKGDLEVNSDLNLTN